MSGTLEAQTILDPIPPSRPSDRRHRVFVLPEHERFDAPISTNAVAVGLKPLQIVSSRPPYIPEPSGNPPQGYDRFYVTWGIVNNVIADNWDDHYDLNDTTYFFVKATFASGQSALHVASTEILTGTAWNTHKTPDWEAGGTRPSYYVFSIGSVRVGDVPPPVGDGPPPVGDVPPPKRFDILDNPGSVMITEHISNITGTGTIGAVSITKQLSHYVV